MWCRVYSAAGVDEFCPSERLTQGRCGGRMVADKRYGDKELGRRDIG